MSRKPNPNPPSPDQQLRISFILDLTRHDELQHLKKMTAYGERPRELLRLALRGLRAEREEQELSAAARMAGLASFGIPSSRQPMAAGEAPQQYLPHPQSQPQPAYQPPQQPVSEPQRQPEAHTTQMSPPPRFDSPHQPRQAYAGDEGSHQPQSLPPQQQPAQEPSRKASPSVLGSMLA